MTIPLIAGLGPQELIIIAAVLVLLFGAKKLPELARGSGQALRIFKSETKALNEDDKKTPEQRELEARNEASANPVEPTPRTTESTTTEPERRTDNPG